MRNLFVEDEAVEDRGDASTAKKKKLSKCHVIPDTPFTNNTIVGLRSHAKHPRSVSKHNIWYDSLI